MKSLLSLLAVGVCACTGAAAQSLITDRGLEDWVIDVPTPKNGEMPAEPTFSIENGVLKTTGKPLGHIFTKESYEDYRLVIEYRYPEEAGNCGVMLHCSEKRFLDGIFPRSIEVQLMSEKAGDIIAIGEDFMSCFTAPTLGQAGQRKTKYEKRQRENAENTVGEWNTMVIIAQGQSLLVTVNGHHMAAIVGCTASKGQIALQSEGVPVEFRKLELTPLGE